ncbi:hypothetical protein V5799_004176, partial [Amblyomma americanum]
MVRLRSVSIEIGIFDNGSFVDGFSIISRFHRCIGYSFFPWKNLGGESRVSATVLTPYLAFAVLSWSILALLLIHDTCRAFFVVSFGNFDKWVIIIILVGRYLGVQVANIVTLVVYSRELCEVVKKMQAIESTFQRPTRLRQTARYIIALNVVFSVVAVFSISDDIASAGDYMEPVYMKLIYGVICLVYSETVCLIGFSWVMYFSRAFASFLRCINEDIESLAVGRPLSRSKLATQHARFCELWYAFVQCDKIFSAGLLIAIPLNILNVLPWGHGILMPHRSLLDLITDVVGLINFCAELFVLGAYCGAALNEDGYHVVTLAQDEEGQPLPAIDKCILMFYFVRCVGIQLANIVTLVRYSRELCEIVNKMEAIESTFQRPARLRPTAKFIVLLNVIFSVAALFSICDEIAEFDGYMEPLHMKVAYAVFSLVFAETV